MEAFPALLLNMCYDVILLKAPAGKQNDQLVKLCSINHIGEDSARIMPMPFLYNGINTSVV